MAKKLTSLQMLSFALEANKSVMHVSYSTANLNLDLGNSFSRIRQLLTELGDSGEPYIRTRELDIYQFYGRFMLKRDHENEIFFHS